MQPGSGTRAPVMPARLIDARAVYDRFRRFPGSEYIAKPGTIGGVSRLIVAHRPKAILEVGAGIGTITHTVLATLDAIGHRARFVSIEHDAFCLAALERNLGAELARVDLRRSVHGLEVGSFDLVIVDGGSLERGGYSDFVARRGRIVVDGFREDQRAAIRARGRRVLIHQVWPKVAADGLYWVIQFEPTVLERAAVGAITAWRATGVRGTRFVRRRLFKHDARR